MVYEQSWYLIIIEVFTVVKDSHETSLDLGREMAIFIPNEFNIENLYNVENMKSAEFNASILRKIGVERFTERVWWL